MPQFFEKRLHFADEYRSTSSSNFTEALSWGSFAPDDSKKISFIVIHVNNVELVKARSYSTVYGGSISYLIRVEVDANLPAPDSLDYLYTDWESGEKTCFTLKQFNLDRKYSNDELFERTRGLLSMIFRNSKFVKLFDE